MDIFGCGYNGFGQLLPSLAQRCMVTPVKIFQEFDLHTNSIASEKLMKLSSSWSTVHVIRDAKLWLQGFYKGKKSAFQSLQTDCVVDIDAAYDKLYCTTTDGKCIEMDVWTGQVKVNQDELGLRTKFLKVAVAERNIIAIADRYSCGFISCENSSYIFRPFDCGVNFSQVHCGKEHVILLSQIHQVYSFGLGSRGQLGHGTTDRESQPRLLEALGGVPVDIISAGGWHSAAVSAIGDLYVWGWNESGQLGFRVQRNSASQHHGTPDGCDDQPHPEKQHIGVKRRIEQHAEQSAQTKKTVASSGSTERSCKLSQSLVQGNLKLIKKGFETSQKRYGNEPHQNQDQICVSGDKGTCKKHTAELMSEWSNNRDSILFQPVPRILDLPSGKSVFNVGCGSRHTAAICGDGCLYTWGWGAYGQLGHGDTLTRYTPTMVKCLTEDQQVIHVSCGAWNTLIGISSRV